MNRKSYWSIPALIISTLILSTLTFLTNCSSSSTKTTTPPPTVTITATSGGGQGAAIGAPFTNPLTATVTTGGTPTSGVTVTFTSPASTDSTFAGGVTTATAMTNSSGVATSPAFTAGTAAGTYTITASAPGATSTASFSLTNTHPTLGRRQLRLLPVWRGHRRRRPGPLLCRRRLHRRQQRDGHRR